MSDPEDVEAGAGVAKHKLAIADLLPSRPSLTRDEGVALDNAHKEAMILRRSYLQKDVDKRDLAASARRLLGKALESGDVEELSRAIAMGDDAELYTDDRLIQARDMREKLVHARHDAAAQPTQQEKPKRGLRFAEEESGPAESSGLGASGPPRPIHKPAHSALKQSSATDHQHELARRQTMQGWMFVNLRATDRVVPRFFNLKPPLCLELSDDRFGFEREAAPWDDEIGGGLDRSIPLKTMKDDKAVYAEVRLIRKSSKDARHVKMPGEADLSQGLIRIVDVNGAVWFLAAIDPVSPVRCDSENPQAVTGGIDGTGSVMDDAKLRFPIEDWHGVIDHLLSHDKYLEHLRTAKPVQLVYRGPNPMNWNKCMLQEVPANVVADTSMDKMYLEQNLLESFPAAVTRLTSLQELWLSHNKIRTIDPEILKEMTCLRLLSLECNFIPTVPDTLKYMTALKEFIITSNDLRSLPENCMQHLVHLQQLHLQYNALEKLPDDLGSLQRLEVLYVNNNKIRRLPSNLDLMTNLCGLYLEHNQLEMLPEGISSLISLSVLNVNYNKVARFPANMKRLTNLLHLKISHNLIEDIREPDQGMLSLSQLQTLHLHRNRILELPDIESMFQTSEGYDLGHLTSLTDLRLDCNNMIFLPRRLSVLEKLEKLDISYNRIIELPVELGGLKALREIRIEGNPVIPALKRVSDCESDVIIAFLRDYMVQDLSGTKLTRVPLEVLDMPYLQTLRLSFNAIQELPEELCSLVSLQHLICDHNKIFMLQPWICQLSNLLELALDYNRLMAMPRELGLLPNLTTLTLEKNCLSTLPMEIGRITSLHTLKLEKNLLRPPVSDAFEDGGMEGVLDLLRENAYLSAS
mmetsp:Transcript_59683/g.146605  ORF Transcript_59683/g.146605 Transcript_59683/m.146605 type:complete len:863 (-) Transcript_59683:35-2623(-)